MADQNQENTTRDASNQAGAPGAGFGDGAAGGMADGMRAATERMRAAGGQIADQGGEVGLKMLDQAEANTREAFRVMREAAQAKDVSEVMRLQSEYLREQGNRSMAQAREIGELIASFGRSAIGQMTGKS